MNDNSEILTELKVIKQLILVNNNLLNKNETDHGEQTQLLKEIVEMNKLIVALCTGTGGADLAKALADLADNIKSLDANVQKLTEEVRANGR